MQKAHLWHLCPLSWQKICLIILVSCSPVFAFAQWEGHKKEKSRYTEDAHPSLFRKNRLKSRFHLGFQLALLRSNINVQYSDEYLGDNNLSSVVSSPSPGAIIGGYASYRINDFLDFVPQFNFFAAYERRLTYNYLGGKAAELRTVESTMFEVPLLIKYRSQLRGFRNMYVVAGVKPSFSLSQKSEDKEQVLLKNNDFAIEYGLGFDVFFRFFKFAPELRFSHGIANVLNSSNGNFYTRQLKSLSTHTATLYFHFGG